MHIEEARKPGNMIGASAVGFGAASISKGVEYIYPGNKHLIKDPFSLCWKEISEGKKRKRKDCVVSFVAGRNDHVLVIWVLASRTASKPQTPKKQAPFDEMGIFFHPPKLTHLHDPKTFLSVLTDWLTEPSFNTTIFPPTNPLDISHPRSTGFCPTRTKVLHELRPGWFRQPYHAAGRKRLVWLSNESPRL